MLCDKMQLQLQRCGWSKSIAIYKISNEELDQEDWLSAFLWLNLMVSKYTAKQFVENIGLMTRIQKGVSERRKTTKISALTRTTEPYE